MKTFSIVIMIILFMICFGCKSTPQLSDQIRISNPEIKSVLATSSTIKFTLQNLSDKEVKINSIKLVVDNKASEAVDVTHREDITLVLKGDDLFFDLEAKDGDFSLKSAANVIMNKQGGTEFKIAPKSSQAINANINYTQTKLKTIDTFKLHIELTDGISKISSIPFDVRFGDDPPAQAK